MTQQIPMVNFPFYDPRSSQGNQQRISSAIGSIGTDPGIGNAIANIPFRKQQLKMGDQQIAAEELRRKQLEAADKEASENPQILGFRYDFHAKELNEKFSKMEDGKSKEFLGDQISMLEEKRNHFFELGKRGQKISSEEARKEHNELEKLYKGIGKALTYIDANKLSSGEFSDSSDLYKKLAEEFPTITKSESDQMTGVEGQKILDKSKYMQSTLESKEKIAGIQEAGKTERTKLSLSAKQTGDRPENAIARDAQTLREQQFSNKTTKEIANNYKRIKELDKIIETLNSYTGDPDVDNKNQIIKSSKGGIETYYEPKDLPQLQDERLELDNQNKQLQKSLEKINIKKGAKYLGTGQVPKETSGEVQETSGEVQEDIGQGELRLGVKVNDLNELQENLATKIQTLEGEPKKKSNEILNAVQMILGGDENQANEGLNFLKVNYTPLYEELINPKGSVQR